MFFKLFDELLILGKKNKRLGLEDAIKRGNRDFERLANPKVN